MKPCASPSLPSRQFDLVIKKRCGFPPAGRKLRIKLRSLRNRDWSFLHPTGDVHHASAVNAWFGWRHSQSPGILGDRWNPAGGLMQAG